MKIRALASLSGPMGRKAAGDEFVLADKDGQALIARRLAEPVANEPAEQPALEKPAMLAKDKA